MPYNSESRIRFHVVLILAIVTMVCLGAMIYFYTFRVNIDQQKEAVKGYSVEVRNSSFASSPMPSFSLRINL